MPKFCIYEQHAGICVKPAVIAVKGFARMKT